MEVRLRALPCEPGAELTGERISVYSSVEKRWYTGVVDGFDATWRVHHVRFRCTWLRHARRQSYWFNLQKGAAESMRERTRAAMVAMEAAEAASDAVALTIAREAAEPACEWLRGTLCKVDGSCMKPEGHRGLCEARPADRLFQGGYFPVQ